MQSTRNRVGQCRFTAAALTSQAQDLPTLQGNAHVVQGMDSATGSIIIDAQITNIQQSLSISIGRCFYKFIAHHPATSLCLSAFNPRGFDSLRKRGLDISSMPKLTKVSAAPNMAMHRPGGRNHHHAPSRRAELLEAEKSILPQVAAVISPRPRYSRAVSARIT